MPANKSVLSSIQVIRNATSLLNQKNSKISLYSAIQNLFRKSEKIVENRETLEAVFSLAIEIETLRGKGSQLAVDDFSRSVGGLVYYLKSRLPESKISPEYFPKEDELRVIANDTDLLECFELLLAHAFVRTQGPPVRSQRAGALRAIAWKALGNMSEILRCPEHLAHALKVAADNRASLLERVAAVNFLAEYWSDYDSDEITNNLLKDLMTSAPSRDFLVTVMQARIELGLDDEFGALRAVDDWDDSQEGE